MKVAAVILFFLVSMQSHAVEDSTQYRLFKGADGKEVSLKRMVKKLKKADVILFGEVHNLSVCHEVQYEVVRRLHQLVGGRLLLGAEMFEADNQLILDEYLAGLIEEKHMIEEAKIWKNYEEDYAPLVNFAKDNDMEVIATNIPRRYARIVARRGTGGLDDLSDQALAYCAPLPIVIDMELPGYKYILEMMGGHMGSATQGNASYMVHAQAVKDATMAYFIVSNLGKGNTLLHLNGSFHSDNYEGIGYYLGQYGDDLKVLTITTVQQEELENLDNSHLNKADFVLVLDADTPKSY